VFGSPVAPSAPPSPGTQAPPSPAAVAGGGGGFPSPAAFEPVESGTATDEISQTATLTGAGGGAFTGDDTQPTSRTPRFELDLEAERQRDRRVAEQRPQTPLFGNPVASGADQLFGVRQEFNTAFDQLL
jgi:hypothetical protein